MAKNKAKWSVDQKNTSFAVDASGTLTAVVPLLDNGVNAITFKLTVTPDRAARLEAVVEPQALLTGFEAWSNS